jgi:hypothetical protein
MSEIEVPEYTLVKADEIRRGSRFRAVESSATVLALGSVIWGGFFLYDLFSNTFRKMENMVSEITEDPLAEVDTVVNPAMLTEEGIKEAVKVWRPGPKTGASGMASKAGYERALRNIAKQVNEGGIGTLTNREIRMIKKGEQQLVKSGMIHKSDVIKIHWVDKAADFVARDKRYWVAVLGLMVVPALPVIRDIAEGARNG